MGKEERYESRGDQTVQDSPADKCSSHRYDRRILGSMTVLIAGLTVCMGILLQMAHVSGIPTVNDGYGSVLLRNGADVYVIIGIIAFVAGVIFTVICIRLRDRKAHKQQE